MSVYSKLNAKSHFISLSISIFLLGCPNVFETLDKPSTEAQILSRARACFDDADFDCAAKWYAQLPDSGVARMEEGFLILADEGISVELFVQAFTVAGNEGVGTILTELAERIAKIGDAGTAKRNRIIEAYSKIDSISESSIKGFLRFMTGLALAAEILAEDPPLADGVMSKADLALNPTTCLSVLCAGAASCGSPATSVISAYTGLDSSFVNSPSTATMSGAPTWSHFHTAILAASTGLSELGVGTGKTVQLINTFFDISAQLPAGQVPACTRQSLLSLGAGRD